MLASVLRSDRAVAVSIAIVRVFVQLRELLATHRKLAAKFAELERRIEGHDSAITTLVPAEEIQSRILVLRDQRVVLDRDLAVDHKALWVHCRVDATRRELKERRLPAAGGRPDAAGAWKAPLLRPTL